MPTIDKAIADRVEATIKECRDLKSYAHLRQKIKMFQDECFSKSNDSLFIISASRGILSAKHQNLFNNLGKDDKEHSINERLIRIFECTVQSAILFRQLSA